MILSVSRLPSLITPPGDNGDKDNKKTNEPTQITPCSVFETGARLTRSGRMETKISRNQGLTSDCSAIKGEGSVTEI